MTRTISIDDGASQYKTAQPYIRRGGGCTPFRYRGYYYDTETGYYYLQTRYYDPVVGRFLNADDPSLIGANGGIQSYNLFAYCNNNPVMGYDPSGELFEDIFSNFIDKLQQKIKKIKNALKRVQEKKRFEKMVTSDAAIALIADYETFNSSLQADNTIGYGHLVQPGEPYDSKSSITVDQAMELLKKDVANSERLTKQYANERNWVLTQQQFDAFVVYGYNVGPASIQDVMDLYLMHGDIYFAFNYRLQYQKPKYKTGLFRRWHDSADIFFYDDYNRDYPNL